MILTIEASGIYGSEDINEGNKRFGGRGRLGAVVVPGCDSDGKPCHAASGICEEQERPATDTVDKISSYHCDNEG